MTHNSFTNAVKEALAKKKSANLPQDKRSKETKATTRETVRATGAPIRKGTGRGG